MGKINEESKIKQYFKNINIYGLPFSIRYKNRSTYTSKTGIILSIFSIVFFTGFTFYYFLQLINHSSFTVLQCNDKSKYHSINLTSIPVMFGFLNSNSEYFSMNEEIFNINVFIKTFNPLNSSVKAIYSPIELENCLNSEYRKIYPKMEKYDLEHFICIKPNQSIILNGRYGDSTNGFKSLNVYFGQCITEECLKKNLSEYNNILYDLFLSVVYLSDVIDNYNYSNPLTQEFRSETFQITPLTFKKYIYYFSSLLYISNNGLIFNDYKNYFSFIFDHIHLDFVGRNNSDSTMIFDDKIYSMIFQFTFSSADYPLIFERQYLKIQDIFSRIGGFVDFVYIVCNAITIYISRKSLVVDITDSLVCHECINACTSKNKRNEFNILKYTNQEKDSIKKSDLNSTNDIIYSKKSKINLNEHKKYDLNSNKYLCPYKNPIINNHKLNYQNSKLDKYLKKSYSHQELKISCIDFIIPYVCLRKYKKYDLLCAYTDIMYSYLSIEEILPSIELTSKLFREKKDEIFFKIKFDSIFTYQNNKNEIKKNIISSPKRVSRIDKN